MLTGQFDACGFAFEGNNSYHHSGHHRNDSNEYGCEDDVLLSMIRRVENAKSVTPQVQVA